jgi:hypothetical protein
LSRYEAYVYVPKALARGLSVAEIARRLGVSRWLV